MRVHRKAVRSLLLAAALLGIAGCGPREYATGGLFSSVREETIDAETVEVTSVGIETERKAEAFTLLRAAELAEARGKRYFVIEEAKTTTTTSSNRYASSSVYGTTMRVRFADGPDPASKKPALEASKVTAALGKLRKES